VSEMKQSGYLALGKHVWVWASMLLSVEYWSMGVTTTGQRASRGQPSRKMSAAGGGKGRGNANDTRDDAPASAHAGHKTWWRAAGCVQ